MGEKFPVLCTIMKVKKMRTLETRSINTFSTRMTMFRGANAPFLSLLLKKDESQIRIIKF